MLFRPLVKIALIASTFLTASCNIKNGSSPALQPNGGTGGLPGPAGSNGLSVGQSTTQATSSQCAYGGTVIATWTGANTDNVYNPAVDSNFKQAVICNGAPGAAGERGSDGTNGLSNVTVQTQLAVGSARCPAGGTSIETWSGVLTGSLGASTFDPSVDTNDQITIICNGATGAAGTNGTNGSNGTSSETLQTVLAAGSSQCQAGGTAIETWTSPTGDASFNAAAGDSNDQTTTLCNGIAGTNGTSGMNAVTVQTAIAPGSTQCAGAGGLSIETWSAPSADTSYTPANGDINDSTSLLCNGVAGAAGANGSQIYVVSGAPSSSSAGRNGDFYLDSSTGNYYQFENGSWGSVLGNLTGPTGAQGSQGSAGSDATCSISGSYLSANRTNVALLSCGSANATVSIGVSTPGAPIFIEVNISSSASNPNLEVTQDNVITGYCVSTSVADQVSLSFLDSLGNLLTQSPVVTSCQDGNWQVTVPANTLTIGQQSYASGSIQATESFTLNGVTSYPSASISVTYSDANNGI